MGLPGKFAHVLYCHIELTFGLTVNVFGSGNQTLIKRAQFPASDETWIRNSDVLQAFSSVQVKMRYLCARKSPYALRVPSLSSFPNVAFETVPMLVWLTMTLSRPVEEDRLALLLSAPLSSMRSMVSCCWLCAHRYSSVSNPSALQIWDRSHF